MSRRSPGTTSPSGPGQATRTVAGGVWQVLDKDRQDRLRRAGERLHEAEAERTSALDELKDAMAEADGDSDPDEASDLTGMSPTVSAAMLDDELR